MRSLFTRHDVRKAIWCAGLILFSFAAVPNDVVAEEKSFLWEVQSETGTVYLLGSVHFATKELYPLKKTIQRSYQRSDHLVVEINPDAVSPEKAQVLMMQRGVYSDGETLVSKISEETYAMVGVQLQKSGMPINLFSTFKPWFIALTLTTLEVQRLGYDPAYGIDRHFLDRAKGRKPVLELETIEEQIVPLDILSDQEQESFLLYTLEDLKILEGQMNALMKAWVDGDAAAVESVLSKSMGDRPELGPVYEGVIEDRNRKMLEKIERYLKTDDHYFVVVGAGHLVGKVGLVEQLRRKGYAVRQL
jgi:uncharacterized protein